MSYNGITKCPSHTHAVFDVDTMPDIVRWAEKACRNLRADAVVACGHSGLLVAGAVSYLTKIPVIAVRKPEDRAVADSRRVNGILADGPAKRWVWLDDLIATGGTFRNAVKQVWNANMVESPFPAALLLYERGKSLESMNVRFDLHMDEIDHMPPELIDTQESIKAFGFSNF
jgi:orotate phosphoribosyltransferase-like protein